MKSIRQSRIDPPSLIEVTKSRSMPRRFRPDSLLSAEFLIVVSKLFGDVREVQLYPLDRLCFVFDKRGLISVYVFALFSFSKGLSDAYSTMNCVS
uniref:Uncharacterized protein n=1 Tax=Octopus bimaculoides TaxID=37653 RepID=A0A0L8FG88_OCTBM